MRHGSSRPRSVRSPRSAPEATDALFVLDVAHAGSGLQAATEVELYGRPASELVSSLDGVDEMRRQLLLTEAALTAWRQRLSDAADAMPQLTSDEAAAFGSVDMAGQPLLTGLRAEQRRLLRAQLSGEDVILGDQSKFIDPAENILFQAVLRSRATLSSLLHIYSVSVT